MAIALVREGADIVAARNSQKLEEAVGEVQRLGRKGVAIPVDVTKSSQVKRYGHPSEIGSLVVYLASDATDFVSGQFMYVDGAVMAHA